MEHTEPNPVGFLEFASDGSECIAKFKAKDFNYVIWRSKDGTPEFILDTETIGPDETVYRRLDSGDSFQLVYDAMQEIRRLFA
tara:strand:- start:272 stop:520 length:249 start_codon:yes stop_codon:yes gene_type:complete